MTAAVPEADPPAYRGYENVVMMVAKHAEILAANEKVAKKPKSRLKTFTKNESAFPVTNPHGRV